MDAALWRNVSRAPWFLARRLRDAGLEPEWAGTANTVRARRGEPTVRIAGLPGELLLYLFGRQRAAQVEVSGPADAVTGYEDLGDPRFRGKLCLRTSNNEYNQSFVADRIAKHGEAETEQLLRSWMANQPRVLGSDVDVLDAIAAGRCDVGLTNHYYLGRKLAEDPNFPVAPAWPDQDGAGAHTNLSGVGLVKGSEHRAAAVRLMEFLTAREAQEAIVENSEFAANPAVAPAEHIRDWAEVKLDPIDVERAGPALGQAVALMQQVGWK